MNDKVKRCESLWQDFLEGDLTEDGLAELRQLLESDVSLGDEALDDYQMHRLLGLHHQRSDEESRAFARATVERLPRSSEAFLQRVRSKLAGSRPAPSKPKWTRWISHAAAALIAAILTLVVHSAWWSTDQNNAGIIERPSAYAATLLRVDDCEWQHRSPVVLLEGCRLLPGELQLERGVALLGFDGGARMAIHAPCAFLIESADSARLHFGQAVVHAPDMAAGFVLHTPASDLVDWGTEFSVSVADSGETELHVHEGLVEWQRPQDNADEGSMVRGGTAVRIPATSAAAAESIPVAGRRFDESIAKMRSRRAVGQLLAYEGFDYRSHDEVLEGGGRGWKGRWHERGYGGEATIPFHLDSGLPMPAQLARAQGGSLRLPAKPAYVYKRELETPLDMNSDAIHYVSLLVRMIPDTALTDPSVLRIILASRQRFVQNVQFGVRPDRRFFVYARGAGHDVADAIIRDDTDYLFVGKIVSSRHAHDQIFLKVFPVDEPVDIREPETWTLVGRPTDLSVRLDSFGINFTEVGGFEVDEIRIGTTWEAVTPLLGDGT